MGRKLDPAKVLRTIVPYPAVFVPNEYGGTDVYFPNFPEARASGLRFSLAQAAAREELTRQLYETWREGRRPPPPSAPETLPPDEEEITGTRLLMIEPDQDRLLIWLGLKKRPWRTSPMGEKYNP
ncbi:MAG: hypothetical protein AB1641_09205 [Thermodesulfobacteriota bacterium]